MIVTKISGMSLLCHLDSTVKVISSNNVQFQIQHTSWQPVENVGKVDETVEYHSSWSGCGTPQSENLGKRFPFENPEYNITLAQSQELDNTRMSIWWKGFFQRIYRNKLS